MIEGMKTCGRHNGLSSVRTNRRYLKHSILTVYLLLSSITALRESVGLSKILLYMYTLRTKVYISLKLFLNLSPKYRCQCQDHSVHGQHYFLRFVCLTRASSAVVLEHIFRAEFSHSIDGVCFSTWSQLSPFLSDASYAMEGIFRKMEKTN